MRHFLLATGVLVACSANIPPDDGQELFPTSPIPTSASPVDNTPRGGFGDGETDGGAPKQTECGMPPSFAGTLRDFRAHKPEDFERNTTGAELGLVQRQLGADKKPVYARSGASRTVGGAASFNQWYRDVAGVNQAIPFTLPIQTRADGSAFFDSSAFFPLDNKGFGNEGRSHNYHFTYELHTAVTYLGGEQFQFRGDDDLWVFINGQLVIDLGGTHPPATSNLSLDAVASTINIERGKAYPFDFFFAERHTSESNFRIETTLNFTGCNVNIPR